MHDLGNCLPRVHREWARGHQCDPQALRLRERRRCEGDRIALEQVIGDLYGTSVFAGGYLLLEVNEQIAPMAGCRNLAQGFLTASKLLTGGATSANGPQ